MAGTALAAAAAAAAARNNETVAELVRVRSQLDYAIRLNRQLDSDRERLAADLAAARADADAAAAGYRELQARMEEAESKLAAAAQDGQAAGEEIAAAQQREEDLVRALRSTAEARDASARRVDELTELMRTTAVASRADLAAQLDARTKAVRAEAAVEAAALRASAGAAEAAARARDEELRRAVAAAEAAAARAAARLDVERAAAAEARSWIEIRAATRPAITAPASLSAAAAAATPPSRRSLWAAAECAADAAVQSLVELRQAADGAVKAAAAVSTAVPNGGGLAAAAAAAARTYRVTVSAAWATAPPDARKAAEEAAAVLEEEAVVLAAAEAEDAAAAAREEAKAAAALALQAEALVSIENAAVEDSRKALQEARDGVTAANASLVQVEMAAAAAEKLWAQETGRMLDDAQDPIPLHYSEAVAGPPPQLTRGYARRSTAQREVVVRSMRLDEAVQKMERAAAEGREAVARAQEEELAAQAEMWDLGWSLEEAAAEVDNIALHVQTLSNELEAEKQRMVVAGEEARCAWGELTQETGPDGPPMLERAADRLRSDAESLEVQFAALREENQRVLEGRRAELERAVEDAAAAAATVEELRRAEEESILSRQRHRAKLESELELSRARIRALEVNMTAANEALDFMKTELEELQDRASKGQLARETILMLAEDGKRRAVDLRAQLSKDQADMKPEICRRDAIEDALRAIDSAAARNRNPESDATETVAARQTAETAAATTAERRRQCERALEDENAMAAATEGRTQEKQAEVQARLVEVETRLRAAEELEAVLRAAEEEQALAEASADSIRPRLEEALRLQQSCKQAVEELAAERERSCLRAKESSEKVSASRTALVYSVCTQRNVANFIRADLRAAESKLASVARDLDAGLCRVDAWRARTVAQMLYFANLAFTNMKGCTERADESACRLVDAGAALQTAAVGALRDAVAKRPTFKAQIGPTCGQGKLIAAFDLCSSAARAASRRAEEARALVFAAECAATAKREADASLRVQEADAERQRLQKNLQLKDTEILKLRGPIGTASDLTDLARARAFPWSSSALEVAASARRERATHSAADDSAGAQLEGLEKRLQKLFRTFDHCLLGGANVPCHQAR